MTTGFSQAQVDQLLKPINHSRVLSDGKGFSHVSQQDVLAHLTRIFGYGNFDITVKSVDLVFETERGGDRYDVCYKALVRLDIRNPQGEPVCSYENGSMETSQNQKRGDGHDLAYKSAISLSIKRCAIALGDQFGLSLYNKGQTSALVMSTLVHPDGKSVQKDVQQDVPVQVSLGNTESDHVAVATPVEAPRVAIQPVSHPVEAITPEVVPSWVESGAWRVAYDAVTLAGTLDELRNLWSANAKHLDEEFTLSLPDWEDDMTVVGAEWQSTLRNEINLAQSQLKGEAK